MEKKNNGSPAGLLLNIKPLIPVSVTAKTGLVLPILGDCSLLGEHLSMGMDSGWFGTLEDAMNRSGVPKVINA